MSIFSFFARWFRRSRTPRDDLHLVMMTRSGCHLCDEAWQLLKQFQDRYGFHLVTCDVDGNPDLRRQYGDWVPVVTVNGKVRFRGHINKVLLQRLLDACASSPTEAVEEE
jgi:hypothetical protein